MPGVVHDVTADLNPDTGAMAGGLFTVSNTLSGTASLGGMLRGEQDQFFLYELPLSSSWLSIEPGYGNLDPGMSEDIDVHLNTVNLLPQNYLGGIHFSTNPDVGQPVISVNLTIENFNLEINLQVAYECTDVNLTWEIPPGGNPDSWNIYRDDVLIGNTTSIGFTEPNGNTWG